jgi:hypothetical protein
VLCGIAAVMTGLKLVKLSPDHIGDVIHQPIAAATLARGFGGRVRHRHLQLGLALCLSYPDPVVAASLLWLI